ncbi:putative oncoprotein-induced transcript 3 protein [Sesbania bispinosa]|nr:putative oncoprotein-induced transcript 3 protein [Sesbania bispinosa]
MKIQDGINDSTNLQTPEYWERFGDEVQRGDFEFEFQKESGLRDCIDDMAMNNNLVVKGDNTGGLLTANEGANLVEDPLISNLLTREDGNCQFNSYDRFIQEVVGGEKCDGVEKFQMTMTKDMGPILCEGDGSPVGLSRPLGADTTRPISSNAGVNTTRPFSLNYGCVKEGMESDSLCCAGGLSWTRGAEKRMLTSHYAGHANDDADPDNSLEDWVCHVKEVKCSG